MIDHTAVVPIILLIPVCTILINACKGVPTNKIFKQGIYTSIVAGILIVLLTESHPHVPSFVVIILVPLYSLAVTAITVTIRYFYRELK